MLAKTRIGAALLCLAALVLLIAIGQVPPATQLPPADARSITASNDCRECHESVWREWETSYHSRAWSDSHVQAAFEHFGFDRRCQSCHAPVRQVVVDVTAPVELRENDQASGVDCLSCHGLAQGVAATRTIANAPCRPQRIDGFSGSRSCGACHQAIYKDWKESRYSAAGKECQSCHMPAVADRPMGRSHLCLGGHTPDLIRSGVKMSVRRDADELVVSATNHATGHNFPGERHNRVLYIQVIERNSKGEITLVRQELIKGITPFRGESSAEKLRVDQTFEARFPIIAPPVAAEVQLLYKSFPWHLDRDALVVARAEVELEAK